MPQVCLVEESTRESHAITGTQFVVGRSAQADLPVIDPKCGRKHFQITRVGDRYSIEPLSAQHATLVDGQRITAAQWLSHGCEVRAGDSVFRFVASTDSEAPARATPALHRPASPRTPTPPAATDSPAGPPTQIPLPRAMPPSSGEMTRVAAPGELPAEPLPSGAFRLGGHQTIGRDAKQADIHLDHPVVSRVHAELRQESGGFTLRDRGSANGTFVNGRRISRVKLAEGDRIDIGPYSLTLRANQLLPESRSNNSHLSCRDLQCLVRDRKTGTPTVLLDDISLVFHPREFVCILGPSGSGKSTLLRALSGRNRDIEGQVSVNGLDLRACFQMLKPEMAMVPQHDILHELLELRRSLRYTARLRLPPDLSDSEIDEAVNTALHTVGLIEHADKRIRDLSGGQRRRASLATELLSRPSLLYLDEVTSGLDELTDRQLMELFQSIATAGKTVVCVTHNLVNIEPTSELIVVLAEGGKLAFVGRPHEAREYFGIGQLGDVYGALATQRPAAWKQRFRKSPYFQEYVVSRLPTDHGSSPPGADSTRERLAAWLIENRRQTRILLQRSLELVRADPRSLGVVLLQSLLVATLLILLFGNISDPVIDSSRDSVWTVLAAATAAPGKSISDEQKANKTADHAAKLLFLLGVSCFWFGCNNSAREIVAQRDLFRHERSFNLEPLAYMVSQFAVLGLLSIVQSCLLVFLVRSSCGMPGGFLSQAVMLSACTLSGVALGLLISAVSRTESMAIACVPILLIPQIILGGLLARVSGLASLLAHGLITSFWSYRGLAATLPEDIREKAAALEVIISADASFAASTLVVVGHGLVAFAIAVVVVHRDGRKGAG